MPWNKVIWWAVLVMIGLVTYATYLQLAPTDLPRHQAEAPALMFQKH